MDAGRESLELERAILREFFESVRAMKDVGPDISDSSLVKQTMQKLNVALRGTVRRCSCAKRSYGMCELCESQQSDDAVELRRFFMNMKFAKKRGLTSAEIHQLVTTL